MMPKNIESKISLQCYKVIYTQIDMRVHILSPLSIEIPTPKTSNMGFGLPRHFQENLGASLDAL